MRRRRRSSRQSGSHRSWKAYLLGIGVVVLVMLAVVVGYQRIRSRGAGEQALAGKTAAIVDQVALSDPNPEFTEQALSYLIAAGFNVDVFEGADITVEFFRTLPTRGYDLILFRTHSTNDFRDADITGDPVYLYTGEEHDRYRYTYLQLTRQIMAGRVLYDEDGPQLFIVGPKFVEDSMQGRFDDTLFVIGGCDSLSTTVLADALIARGASAVVGWDGLVDLHHNDQALLQLLRSLTVDGLSVEQAVAVTRDAVGPDPTFNSVPAYYPSNQGAERISFTVTR